MDNDNKFTGLRMDIELLLQAFLQTQNVRYQMFAEEWRRLNFSFIHYGIMTPNEKKGVMQEAFSIAMEYFLPPYDLQRRVGALYTLYGLYTTQPHVPKFKIRVSIEQWQHITSMLETLESQGHLDAIYIFHKLKMSRAFLFSAMPKRMIFHNSYVELKPTQNSTERWLDLHKNSLITECFDDNTLQLHHGLHKEYQNMKAKLGLHDNTSMMVVKESITEYIAKRVEKMEANFENTKEEDTVREDDEAEGSVQNSSSKIAEIKARSFSTVAKMSRSRRHRQQTADPPSPVKSKVTKSNVSKKKGGKGYQKPSSEDNFCEDPRDETWTLSGRKNTPKKSGKGPTILLKKTMACVEESMQKMREESGEGGIGNQVHDDDSTPETNSAVKATIDQVEKTSWGKTISSIRSRKSTAGKSKPIINEPQSNDPTAVSSHSNSTENSKQRKIHEESKNKSKKRKQSDETTSTQLMPTSPLTTESPQMSHKKLKQSPKKKTTANAKKKSLKEQLESAQPAGDVETKRKGGKPRKGSTECQETVVSQDVNPKEKLGGLSPATGETNDEHSPRDVVPIPKSQRALRSQGSALDHTKSPSVGQRSTSVRGRAIKSQSVAGTRGQLGSSPQGQGSSPTDSGSSSSRSHRSSPGQRSSPSNEHGGPVTPQRHNTTLKMRGGGVKARTRGARQNISK